MLYTLFNYLALQVRTSSFIMVERHTPNHRLWSYTLPSPWLLPHHLHLNIVHVQHPDILEICIRTSPISASLDYPVKTLVPWWVKAIEQQPLQKTVQPWLVCLSEWSVSLWTERSPVWSPVRAHAWVAGQVPGWGCVRGHCFSLTQWCFSPSLCPSLSLSLPSSLSKNKLN